MTKSFKALARWVAENVRPKRVLCIGCGEPLAGFLKDRGIDCCRLDVPDSFFDWTSKDALEFLFRGFPHGRFDLVVCAGIVDVLSENERGKLAERLCSCSDDITISSKMFEFSDTSYRGFFYRDYWIKLFSKLNFSCDPFFKGRFSSLWCMRFRKRPSMTDLRVGYISSEVMADIVSGSIRISSPISECCKQYGMKAASCLKVSSGDGLKKLVLNHPVIEMSDIILVHREWGHYKKAFEDGFYESLKRAGKKLVYDLDDFVFGMPSSNPNFKFLNEAKPYVERIMELADAVTVTTPEFKRLLLELYPNLENKVVILPNYIDLELWGSDDFEVGNRVGDNKLHILFCGTSTHRNDFIIIKDVIWRFIRKHSDTVEFEVWGEGNVPSKFEPYVKAKFKLRYTDYVRSFKKGNFNLVIVPLEDNRFNRCKSSIKWLEAGICGVPGIFSNLPPYYSVTNGLTGMLVENSQLDWMEALELAVNNPDWLAFMGEKAREDIIKNYTFQGNAFRWFDLYCSVLGEDVVSSKISERNAFQPVELKLDKRFDPLVSIVIPVFNKVEYTRKCLESLYRVTPGGLFELIIVDNGSTDETPEFLKRFSKEHRNITIISNKENLGFAKACNQGARRARGKYIVFLNNDTVLLEGWLEELVRVAETEKNVGVVGAKLLFPDGTIQHAGVAIGDHPFPISPFHIFRFMPSNYPEANVFRDLQVVTAACMLVPKKLFDELGGFDEGFLNGYEDVDLCFRVREAGHRVVYTPRSVLYHYESVTEGRFNFVEENERRLIEKWKGKIEPDLREVPPKVSIVVVNYNGSEDTIECLKSIYEELMYKIFQVVLVDNGSDPEDVSSLKKWIGSSGVKREGSFEKELIFIESKENLGFSGGNNLGIKYALSHGADYIWLLNNDTVVTYRALYNMVVVAEDDPKIGLVASKIYCYDDPKKVQYNGRVISYEGEADSSNDDLEPRPAEVISGSSLLIKSALLKEIGLFDEDYFLYFEDNDIFARALKAGWKAYYCPTSSIYHKGGASTGQWFKTPLSVYYATRNILIYGSKFNPRGISAYFSRLRSEFYPHASYNPFCVYAFCQGIEDFIRGIRGKSSIPFDNIGKLVDELILSLKKRSSPSPKGFKEALHLVKAKLVSNPKDEASLDKFIALSQSLFAKKISGALDLEVDEAERLYEKGDVEGAISKLNDVLWLDPDSFKAHNGLAFIYWQTGKQKEALEHAVKAMELAPDDRDVVWNAGQIMIGLGYIKDAYEMYKGYLERHPEEGEIREIVEKMEESLKGS